jgi:hypothetical protein
MNNDGEIQQDEMDVDTGTDVEDNVDDELGPDSADDVAADAVEEPAKKKRKTRLIYTVDAIESALTKLKDTGLQKISKVNQIETTNRFFETQHSCVHRYLQLLLENIEDESTSNKVLEKIEISLRVASGIWDTKSAFSFKARCIRKWADHYLVHGSFKEFKQGKH